MLFLVGQKWENAVKEHIRYSDNLVKLGGHDSDDDKGDDVVLPLGSLQDTLQVQLNPFMVHYGKLNGLDCIKESNIIFKKCSVFKNCFLIIG